MERMGKMRYGWKKTVLTEPFWGLTLVYVCVLCCFLAGCRDRAVLYDSTGGTDSAAWNPSAENLQEVNGNSQETAADSPKTVSPETEEQMLCVYVCGEVRKPGVYELEEGGRIVDAVEAAGGMTEEAFCTWLNLAEPLSDGQKVEVPSKEQAENLRNEEQEAQSGLVNLNTASQEELMTLTGIGESKAQAIISYREEHGDFERPEELMEIPGIKEGVFQKIQDQITV